MSDSVRAWLERLGLERYAAAFEKNAIELDQLPGLTDDDLKELGVAALGHRKRLLDAAVRRSSAPAPLAQAAVPGPVTHRGDVGSDAEHRHLTIMFCDLVGSVELGERMDLEDYRALLERFREAVTRVVEEHQGFIARHQGDGLLVYFGYPRAREDDAERAVRAGSGILDAVEQLEGPDGCGLRVRVGIASGPSVVGDVLPTGASERSELAALGPTPNLAARLQHAASPGSVVVSEITRALTSGLFDYLELAPQVVKGVREPVHAYRLHAELRGRSRFAARSQAGLSPLVGRAEELEQLRRRWLRVKESSGQVTLIVGQAGIGKSRLVEELRDVIGGEPHATLFFQCSPYHENSALYPIVAALERRLQFAPSDEPHARLGRLRVALRGLGIDDEDTLGFLTQLLSLPFDVAAPTLAGENAQQRREGSLAALVRLVTATARRAPLLLVFEDVHWSDSTTRELLARLVEAVEHERVMIVATARNGYEAQWLDAANARVLHLSRMAADESWQLARAVVSNDELADDVLAGFLARAGGNPLYIEELVRGAIRRGDVTGIPASLQDLLASALDASREGKSVAQHASVIGRQFSRRMLELIWEGAPGQLALGLDALMNAGLIQQRGEGDATQYTFKHALVRDAAYATLLREHRQRLHARVAEALTQHFPEVPGEQPELLARHYEDAGLREEAIPFWQRAAEAAMAIGALDEAIAQLKRALELADALDDLSARVARTRTQLRVMLAGCFRMVERVSDAFGLLGEAERTAAGHGLDRELARIYHMLGNLYFPRGELERCLEHHEKSLLHARRAKSTDVEALALGGLGDAHYMSGALHTSLERYLACIDICRTDGLDGIEAAHLPNAAMCYRYLLEFDGARGELERATGLAQSVGNPRAELLAWGIRAWIGIDAADLDAAEHAVNRRIALCELLGARRFLSAGLGHMAAIRHYRGDEAGALAAIGEAIEIAREMDMMVFVGPYLLGRLMLASSDARQRRACASEATSLLQRSRICHNYLDFYGCALEAALTYRDLSQVEEYATALEQYASDGPLAWADFRAARGRALAQHGRGERSDALRGQIATLRDTAKKTGMMIDLPLLDAALESFDA